MLLLYAFIPSTVLAFVVINYCKSQVVHKKKKKSKVDSDDEMEAVCVCGCVCVYVCVMMGWKR
jgi:hypothetical protein